MNATFINRAAVEAAYVTFSTVFDMKLKSTPTLYDRVATVIYGISERVEFKWLGEIPTMKRWVGDRAMQKLRGESVALVPEWWANGLEISVDDLNSDSKFGMIPVRIRTLAEAAGRRIDEQVFSFYINGFAGTLGLTYDGQFLFDTDHTASGLGGGVSQSNLQTGPLNSANFNSALQKALLFVDAEGEPIGTTLDLLTVGPQNQLAARQLLKAEYNAGGATNIDAGMAPWIVAPRITGTHWILQGTGELRGVILGIEREPQFVLADDPASIEMFMRNNILAGAHVKFGACYGFWQNQIGSTG